MKWLFLVHQLFHIPHNHAAILDILMTLGFHEPKRVIAFHVTSVQCHPAIYILIQAIK